MERPFGPRGQYLSSSGPSTRLGQIDVADPPWDREGTYFVFVDLRCGLACTVYQQT